MAALFTSQVPKLLTRIRGDDQSSYFHHKSRKYNWIVQGQFIREGIGFDEVITGQEFGRPFRNAPSSKLVQHLLDMLKHKLPDSFDCDFSSDKPYFEHPLLSGCQHFRIDEATKLADVEESELHGIEPDGNVLRIHRCLEMTTSQKMEQVDASIFQSIAT